MSEKQKKPMRTFNESVRAGVTAFVGDALRRGFRGFGASLKRPIVLLPAVIVLLAQTALSLIKISAPNSNLVHILSMLTFAQGGMYAGFIGKVGGVVGKSLLAGMITKLFMKSKGQKPPKCAKPQGGSFALVIPGLGAGLIAYNFLTGNACMENAMIGVTSAITVFRMAGNQNAFLPGFLRSFRRGKTPAGAARSVLLGGGAGLVLGVLTSLRGGGYLCYALGAVLLIIGLVLTLITKNKRAVAVAAALLLCLSPLAGLVTTAQAAGDSITLTLESIQDNIFYPWTVSSRPQVTLVPGKNTSMELSSPGAPINYSDVDSNMYLDTGYTFDFIWQGNNVWNCESSMFCRYVYEGKELGDGVCVKDNANVTIDKSLIGSELVIPIACITANDLPDFWLETGIGVFFAETQTATFTVSADAPASHTSGIWTLAGQRGGYYSAEIDDDSHRPVGNADYTPLDWDSTVSVDSYDLTLSSGKIEVDRPVFGSHTVLEHSAPSSVGANEYLSFKCSDYLSYDNGEMSLIDNITQNGRPLFSYTYALGGYLPDSVELDGAMIADAGVEFRGFTLVGVDGFTMPAGGAAGDELTVRAMLCFAQFRNSIACIEYLYRWTPITPEVLPEDGTEQNDDGGDYTGEGGLYDEDGFFDENDFFDGEDWLDYDESYEHTDTEETLATDAAAFAGGMLAALLAAGGAIGGGLGGALGGFPPLPDSPYIKRDPDDPSYATITSPSGSQSLYRYDEASGLWRDPYSDSYLEPGQIGRAMRDAQRDRAFSEGVIGQMEDRNDAASMWQKQMFKMEQQEKRFWTTGGTYGGVLEKQLADQLKKLRRQMIAGGKLDVAQYEKVRNAIGKISRGEILDDSHIVTTSDKWTVSEIAEGLALTGREIGTSSSWKAWAMRGLLAVGTGGASEKAFDLSDALYTMHDSYMAGDSEGKAFAKAIGGYITGELIGDAVKGGLKKVGGAIADSKVGQKVFYYVKDMIDPATKQADDAAKAAKQLALTKEIPGTQADLTSKPKMVKLGGEVGAAPKLGTKPQLEMELPKRKSKVPFDALQDDKRIALLKKDAQAEIQKMLDKLRAEQNTDPLQTAANKRAAVKISKLQIALDELKKDPGNPVKHKAAEEAAMLVQQDKAGIRFIKQSGDVPTESRQIFNAMKTQKDQIATANTREILAKKFGVDPQQVKSIEPSNTMTTSELRKVGEADGIYKEAATGSAESAKRFTEKDFPLDIDSASKTGVSSDIDKTMRIEVEEIDPKTGQTVVKQLDIPSSELKAVYEEEFYRSWHGGEIPTKTVNGKIVPDTETINCFAKEMDVACNDKFSTESYSDLVEAMKKNGVKNFSDVNATSLTTAHKSNEWFQKADILEKNAGGDLDILSQVENLRTEGIRQATKQFENLTMRQAREINLARHIERVKVPDTLIQRMEVLKRVDKLPPDGISTSEAEAILKQMGTSTERTLEQFYAVTEMLNKWK